MNLERGSLITIPHGDTPLSTTVFVTLNLRLTLQVAKIAASDNSMV